MTSTDRAAEHPAEPSLTAAATSARPGVGVAAALPAVVGFFVAAVLPRATWPLIDGDVWWHIRAGQEVLQSGAIPHVDTWSIVAAGARWISQDWLSNVILAAGNDLGPWGQTGLSFLFGAFTVAAFWLLWRAMALRVREIGWLSRIVWLSVGLVIGGPVMGVRVQVFDLLMTAAVVWLLWSYLVEPRRRYLAGLPVVAAVWANLHAGWLLLFLLGGAVLVGEAADRLLRRQLDPAPLTWLQLRDLGLALVISAGALVINPNGVALYQYPFYTVGITSLSRYVMEWFPASLDTLFGWLLAGFVVLGALPALAFGWRRMRASDLLVLVGVTVMGYQAIRFLLITGPIGGAIVGIVLAPVLSGSRAGRWLAPTLRRLSARRPGAWAAVNIALAAFLILLGTGVALYRVNPAAQATEIARVLPADAVTWIKAQRQDGPGEFTRVFNRYEWGGYLGEQIPSLPIFMDGRADVYGDALLRQYVSVIGLSVDPQTVFDKYGIDYVLFPPDTPLAGWLDASSAWRQVYEDTTAAVWVRR
jgi:hypothetical protein